MITSDVENYPGYPDGIMGPEMMADFRRQAERFGAEFVTDDVTSVDFSERPFKVLVGKDEYRAQAVIVSTGASARWLGIESEEQHKGRGVSACATCDAAFFRQKDVYVVGGGDSAFEEALFLTKFAATSSAPRGSWSTVRRRTTRSTSSSTPSSRRSWAIRASRASACAAPLPAR